MFLAENETYLNRKWRRNEMHAATFKWMEVKLEKERHAASLKCLQSEEREMHPANFKMDNAFYKFFLFVFSHLKLVLF